MLICNELYICKNLSHKPKEISFINVRVNCVLLKIFVKTHPRMSTSRCGKICIALPKCSCNERRRRRTPPAINLNILYELNISCTNELRYVINHLFGSNILLIKGTIGYCLQKHACATCANKKRKLKDSIISKINVFLKIQHFINIAYTAVCWFSFTETEGNLR